MRIDFPGRWPEEGRPELGGRVRCRRRFGYPGRIDSHERVWLTIAGLAERAVVTLNGTGLGTIAGPAEFEVTALLQARNDLCVDLEGPVGQGGLWGEVALEVRCTAYLHKVRAWIHAAGDRTDVYVAGTVIGWADRPLDLYLLVDGTPAAETQITATSSGQPFELAAPLQGSGSWGQEPHCVQVDLVNVAVVWYIIILPLMMEASGRPV
jgi:hypothetical protein